jgi:excisionase family DNA binding protein
MARVSITESLRLLVKPPEAAEMLSISKRSLWSRTASGEIPSVRIGRSVRYSIHDLHDWVDAQKEQELGQ